MIGEHVRLDPLAASDVAGLAGAVAGAQRTAVNSEAKLLLLSRAFDELGCNAVELRTHRLNVASRSAIERLGATLDGVLRHHVVMPDGSLRDTCVYSILAAEWPGVRDRLRTRLANLASGRTMAR